MPLCYTVTIGRLHGARQLCNFIGRSMHLINTSLNHALRVPLADYTSPFIGEQ